MHLDIYKKNRIVSKILLATKAMQKWTNPRENKKGARKSGYCREQGIVLQAFAALGHSSKPNLLEDPVVTAIAQRVKKTPAQVLLAWDIQRGTAPLTTSKTRSRILENFDVSAIPEDAVREISDGITSRVRFNAVLKTGVPGFIPREK
jgi:diketogulonate reductase-like aldo/keto reductase